MMLAMPRSLEQRPESFHRVGVDHTSDRLDSARDEAP